MSGTEEDSVTADRRAQLAQYATTVSKLDRAIQGGLVRRAQLAERHAEIEKTVGLAKSRVNLKEDVTSTLEKIQTRMQEATVGAYARLLTALVQDVINQKSAIDVGLTVERGQPALSISSYDLDSPDYKSNVYENSGAMTNVVSAGLRVIAVAKSGGRRMLVLDEPDCWIRDTRVAKFYEVLRGLCREIGFQIVVISHHDASKFGADCRIINMVVQPRQGDEPDPADGDGAAEGDTEAEGEGGEPAKPVRRRRGKKTPVLKNPRTTIAQPVPFADGTSWAEMPDDHPGVRDIRIRNLATLKDVTIELDPYMTVIAGDVDVGKSRIVRAVRAALYGDVSDSDIRHGEAGLAVDLTIEGGVRVEFSRELKRNPVNLWIARDEAGDVITYDGQICESRGRGVPEWIAPLLGVIRHDDLDLQISHQKKPVFLIDQTPNRQAAVLAVGQEIQWLRDMQTKYKQRLTTWNQEIRSGEQEVATITQELDRTARLEVARETVESLAGAISATVESIDGSDNVLAKAASIRSMSASLERKWAVVSAISRIGTPPEIPDQGQVAGRTDTARRIRSIQEQGASRSGIVTTLASLPEPPSIRMDDGRVVVADSIRKMTSRGARVRSIASVLSRLPSPPEIATDDDGRALAGEIRRMAARVARGRKIVSALDNLPEPPSGIQDLGPRTETLGRLVQSVRSLTTSATQTRERLSVVERDIAAAEAERASLLEEAGDTCPVCGGVLSMEHGDGHAEAHETAPFETRSAPAQEPFSPKKNDRFNPSVAPQPAATDGFDLDFDIDLTGTGPTL